MTPLEKLRLTGAGQSYAVSNTPYFLVRKLREDPEVRAIAEEHSSEDILEDLRSAISREPTSVTEAVRPYALLVALWDKPRIEELREAANLNAPFLDWYPYVGGLLLQTFSPVQKEEIPFPGMLLAPPISISLRDPVTLIDLGTK